MEILCHHCNAAVEEGVPFCPRCDSPQIRVNGAPDASALPPEGISGAKAPYSPPANWQGAPPYEAGALSPGRIRWKIALPGAILTGTLAGIVSIRFGILVVLLIPLAAATTVQLYRRRTGELVTPGMGAKLGGLAGLFSYLVLAAAIVLIFVFSSETLQTELQRQMATRPLDAQQAEVMRRLIGTPDGRAFLCTLMVAFMLPFVEILATLGGALGAVLFGKNK